MGENKRQTWPRKFERGNVSKNWLPKSINKHKKICFYLKIKLAAIKGLNVNSSKTVANKKTKNKLENQTWWVLTSSVLALTWGKTLEIEW